MTEYSDEHAASKTQRKREMQELVEKSLRLMELKPEIRARLPLMPAVQQALDEADRIRSPEARRRHAHHLARLLEDESGESTLAALDQLDDPVRQQRLHKWVDSVTAAPDNKTADGIIADVLAIYPFADRQHLRSLIRNVIKQRPENDAPESDRFKRERKKLAQYLNDLEKQAPLGGTGMRSEA